MKISLLVTPFDDQGLAHAAQVGVEQIGAVYPGTGLADLQSVCQRVESFGMKLGVIERLVPTLGIVPNEAGRE